MLLRSAYFFGYNTWCVNVCIYPTGWNYNLGADLTRWDISLFDHLINLTPSNNTAQLLMKIFYCVKYFFHDEVVYTPDSLEFAELCRSMSKLIETVPIEIPGMNSDEVRAIVTPYLDIENRKKYSFHSRADILVFYLFLNGYNKYFSQNTNLKPSLQQISKYNSAQRGIIDILQSNEPISMELQQPGFEYKENHL